MHRVNPKPFFKHLQPSALVQRRLRKKAVDDAEDAAKARVRRRDKGCRFPLCGCRRLRLNLEVSHSKHKGMGSDPSGERSRDELLMLLCRERHQTNPFSIHSGRIAWEPLRKRDGSNGPVRWLLDIAAYNYYRYGRGLAGDQRMVVVATETSVGEPVIVEKYRDQLEHLGTMQA